MMRALLLCLLLALPAIAAKPDGIKWTKVGAVVGVTSNYTPVVQLGGSQIRVYANTDGTTDGDLWLRTGSWSGVGGPSMVFATPPGDDDFIRTTAVARGDSGMYYAVVYVGPCYGCVGGFSPAWATSIDGYVWDYHGRISPFGINQSSAANLIVDEARNDDYRFMFWMDIPSGLFLVHSGDGMTWSSDGVNVWPIAGEVPQFVAAAKDQFGYHLIGADKFDGTTKRKLRHVWSCDGFPPWRVLETASDVGVGSAKGTNLVFDPQTNLIHALTAGVHWTLAAQPYPC